METIRRLLYLELLKYMSVLKFICSILAALVILPQATLGYSGFYKEGQRGWFWFEKNYTLPNEITLIPQENSNTKSAKEELEVFQAKLEEAKAAMIMRPNIENTKRYIQYQNELFLKSDLVSANWKKTLLYYPELDITRQILVSKTGADIRASQTQKQNAQLHKQFSERFDLVFFYSENCGYCEEFAKVLKYFIEQHGYKLWIYDINLPQHKALIETYNVKYTPSLFAYDSSVIIPITHKFLAIDELERSVLFIAGRVL